MSNAKTYNGNPPDIDPANQVDHHVVMYDAQGQAIPLAVRSLGNGLFGLAVVPTPDPSASALATEATLKLMLQALTVGSLTTAFTVQSIPNGQTLQYPVPLQGIAVGSTYVFAVTGAPAGVIVTAATNGTANVVQITVLNATGSNITTPFTLSILATKN